MKKFIVFILIFTVVAVGSFFGFNYLQENVWRVPGEIIYDNSLTQSERDFLGQFLSSDTLDLMENVTITASTIDTRANEPNTFLYDIYVPVTGFYNPASIYHAADGPLLRLLNSDALQSCDTEPCNEFTSEFNLVTEPVAPDDTNYYLTSIRNLTYAEKLLSVDDKYFLDDFNSGALFRYIKLTATVPEDLTQVSDILATHFVDDFPTADTTLSFAQTGVTALSRGMLPKLNSVGDATYFAANIRDFLSSKDLTHISNESSFTDRATSNNICSDWRFLDTILAIGTDIVELTGNHNQDCGDTAALDTIAKYRELGLRIVGGGTDINDASTPLEISDKNSQITMLAFNYSTGGMTYDNTPGANPYNEAKIAEQIAAAKSAGHTVIVDIQFNECSNYDIATEATYCEPANSSASRDGYTQSDFFKHMIDLGADIVVGTSAHQPQTYELYKNGAIYYGLGNLFFDQIWWPGTTRSLILAHYFYKNQLLQTRITPTSYDKTMQTKLMDEETATWYLNRLNAAR